MKKTEHIWRSDITGLRALAVIPVLLYHAWPDFLPGGFAGVDIFFVISGYLISGILFRQIIETGTINFKDFYAKRIRRIIPNLLCVLSFCLFVGWFFLTDKEYADLARQSYASILFYQNFQLLKELGNYFAESANLQPLLHLWSLAIEEQFYILFPLLCCLIWRLSNNKNYLFVFIIVIVIGSFIFCLSIDDQAKRFYFPIARFWELGVGIVLAYCETFFGINYQRSLFVSNLFSITGILLIVLSLIILDESHFPGVSALLPTIGALLIIFAGYRGAINRLISTKFFVVTGLISYSLYLWHWPFLAFLNIIHPMHNHLDTLLVLLVSIGVSICAYRYVETPVRLLRGGGSKIKIGLLFIVFCFIGFFFC